MDYVADRFDAVGTATGALLAVAGLGTLAGMPWQYANSGVVTAVQVLGALLTVALGAALVWLAHVRA